jgi:MYXO-CTERM domain-containing protein
VGAEGAAGPGVARIDASIAHLVAQQGRYGEAEKLYAHALGAIRSAFGDDHPDVAQLYVNQAVMYWEQGKRESAIAAMQLGVETRERHVSRTLATGSEEERRLLLSSTSAEMDWAVDLHEHGFPGDDRAKRLALLAAFQGKGRLLEVMQDTNRALRDHLGPDERQLFEQLKAVRARIAQLAFASHTAGGPEKARVALALLGKQAAGLEARIAARSALFRSVAQPVTIELVAKQLPADVALVEVVSHLRYDPRGGPLSSWGERRYSAYVLKSDQSVAYVELGAAQAIDASVAAFRDVLRDPRSNPLPRARELDELVMRPIRRLVGGVRNLIISGDGSLSLIPFGALVDERNRYLIDEWSIRYLSTGRELLRPFTGPSRTAALVVANPTFDAPATWGRSAEVGSAPPSSRNRARDGVLTNFGPLSGTLDEGQAVARSLQVPLLSGSEASVEALLELKGPRILHVATHGFFLGDAQQVRPGRGMAPGSSSGSPTPAIPIDPLLRSGLALAGANLRRPGAIGILTALEASSLDLWGTRLVVLSACDTGVGTVSSRDGVYGLRRSLTLAGAESLVMSLWKVDDDATRDLMITYYDALSTGGNRAASLRDVQLSMRRGGRYAHPYYWASFIALGEEGPLGESPELPPALPRLGSRPPALPPLGAARGCGCRVAETGSRASSAWLGALLFGAFFVQRRSGSASPSILRARRRRNPRNETRSTFAAAE